MSKRQDENMLHATRVEIQDEIQRAERKLASGNCKAVAVEFFTQRITELRGAVDGINRMLEGGSL